MGLTEKQRAEYTEMFQTLDKDNSGDLSMSEFVGGLTSMGFEESITEIVAAYFASDENKDRKLTIPEFMTQFEKMSDEDLLEAELRREFRRLDKDNSGCLSREEFPEVFKARNITFTDETIQRWFDAKDKDKSGTLSYEEAITIIKKMNKR